MKKRALIACLAVLALGVTAGAQMTPWLQWTLLPKTQMSEIVGEASGENAWKMIMETGGYDKDRSAAEFADLFYEVKFYQDRLKEYGFKDVELAKYPGGTSWDAVKGELWEVTPIRQKLASYRDMAAMLATGSATGEAKGELVWVGLGRPEDLKGKDLAGKIVVTEGSAGIGPPGRRPHDGRGGRHLDSGHAPLVRPAADRLGQRRGRRWRPWRCGRRAGNAAQAGDVRVPDPAARRRVPEAPADGQPEDHGRGEGDRGDPPDHAAGPGLGHPRHRPVGGRGHLLGAPVRGVREDGRQRRHLGLRDAGRNRPHAQDAHRRGSPPASQAHHPLHHRPGVLAAPARG